MEEEQQVREKTIPVFTVLKNGAILKNIFVVNSRDFSSPERKISTGIDDDEEEVEEILVVGRHPDCDILLTHPSISRFHLEIRSISSLQKLFVTDLSSVHGTWVRDQRLEPHACVEVKEGDTVRIGGSTRIYRLHWIPLSRAYDFDNPFVSLLDASTVMEQEEENRMIEAEENVEVAQHESLENTASGDDGDIHLDVTSEGTGSSVPSEDEDTYVTTVARDSVETEKLQFSEDLHTSTKWDLDFVEGAVEEPSNSCIPSTQQSGVYVEGLGLYELFVDAEADECDVRGDGDLLLDVMSESMQLSVSNEDEEPYLAAKETSSLSRVETETLRLTEDVQASPEMSNTENQNQSSGCSPSKEQIDGCFEASGCSAFEMAHNLNLCSQFKSISEFVTKLVMEASAEPLTMAETRSHEDNGESDVSRQIVEVSPNSVSQAETTLDSLTEEVRSLIGGEFLCEVTVETASENLLHQMINGETKAYIQSHEDNGAEVSRQVIAVSPNPFSQDEPTEEVSSLIGGEFLCEVTVETVSENLLYQIVSGETKTYIQSHEDNETEVRPCQVLEVSPNSFSQAEPTSEILTASENLLNRMSIGEREAEIRRTEVSAQVIAVAPSSFSQTEPTLEILTDEARSLLGSDFLSEVPVETETENLLHQKSNGETEVLRQVISASPNSFFQAGPTTEVLTEELVGSEFESKVASETESENLQHQISNGETKVDSGQSSEVTDCVFAGNECLSRINTEDIQSLCSSWQPLPKSEVESPYEINSEVVPAGNQNQESGIIRETEKMFDEGSSSSCLFEDLKQSGTQSFLSTPNQKPIRELSFGSERSEKYYSLCDIECEEDTDKWCPITSDLAAETFEDTKPIEEMPSDDSTRQENQTHAVRDNVLSEMDSSSTCNLWSRRGKADSVLQLRTNKSEGKQKRIGNQPKDQLHRKQVLTDKPISLIVHHGAEILEPEIFTPDKENLTPSSHMLKRLQDIGDVKDSKSSSSKLSGKSCSSNIHSNIAIMSSGAFTEPEIFTPDKENLTPNSHMLKRLRDVGDIKDTKGSSSKVKRKPFFDINVEENLMTEQKPDVHSKSSKSKVKHEPVAPKKKAEREPFKPLLEKSSSQSQSYTEASSTASARNNTSRGIRSSSILSDGKSKMKWTIVLDTSSLLDKESRKPLHLLQGLKGTHMVVPRTVLRELNEVKRTRSLLFRRRTEIASSALDWIEECKVNTKWWIQVQSPSEETKANAPTPPVTPLSNGSAAFPFSLHWNNNNAPEIESPTSEDQVLECALLYRNRNRDEKLVILSNDVTLKIKAMAEGVICETANEFYESLVNPFSERFMWTESTARGRTWSHLDDVVLRERYNNNRAYNGGRGEIGAAAKGLKLILLHNSHYGQTH